MIGEFLGEKRTSGMTDCDRSGKFNYKSKEHRVNLFLRISNSNGSKITSKTVMY